jgi:hypothetical protein
MAILAGLVGCATPPPGGKDEISKIYGLVHGEGEQDAVRLLKEGMKERRVYGTTDPYIPVRKNEDVRQIWVPDYVDPVTNRLVHGHWESTVLKEGSWYIDD